MVPARPAVSRLRPSRAVGVHRALQAAALGAGLVSARWSVRRLTGGSSVALPPAPEGAATVSVVVAEFVAGRIGLGAVMIVGYAQLDTPLVFGALFVLTLVGLAYYLSALLLETLVLRWFNLAQAAE